MKARTGRNGQIGLGVTPAPVFFSVDLCDMHLPIYLPTSPHLSTLPNHFYKMSWGNARRRLQVLFRYHYLIDNIHSVVSIPSVLLRLSLIAQIKPLFCVLVLSCRAVPFPTTGNSGNGIESH